jgi:EAL domain-containing protein (putative c-di-GMP-specific phosphodiesterase class I)
MRMPVELERGDAVLVSASVGIAGQLGAADPDVAVRNADIAMYLAKANGRDRVEVYDPEVHAALLDEMELIADLRRIAGSGEQMRLEFQPVVLLSDSEPVGMEALLRWDHPTRGPISPATFVPLAERAGLMRPIGTWVLERACAEAARWFTAVPDTTLQWISVNVSAEQLIDGELVVEVERALAESGLAARHLVLEITESSLVRDTAHVAALLSRVRALGVRIAIDDFGTGYSSLSYLSELPVDILKVDRSFVQGTSESGRLSVLAATILDLTRNLHVTAIAEGLERVEQVRSFLAQRCELGQGFLFARPMRDAAVHEYLAAHARHGLERAG